MADTPQYGPRMWKNAPIGLQLMNKQRITRIRRILSSIHKQIKFIFGKNVDKSTDKVKIYIKLYIKWKII